MCFVVTGSSSILAGVCGLELPVESVALQALVSEPIKPVILCRYSQHKSWVYEPIR